MEMFLKITVGLLLVQACHLASLQYSTDSPGRTIDKSYLRGLAKKTAESQNAAGEETEYDQTADEMAFELTNEYHGGTASDSSEVNPEEENNVTDQDKDANLALDDLTMVPPSVAPLIPTVTTKQPDFPDTTMSPTISTMNPANPSQINMTDTEENVNSMTTLQNSISQQNTQNTTNHSDLLTSTSAPETKATQQFTTPGVDAWSTNTTGSTNTTPVTTTSSSTTVFILATTEMTPTTTAPLSTPEMANMSDEGSAKGSDSERGLESDSNGRRKTGSWGAVLGTAAAVACVGIVVYIILKKKHKKGFSHRKLVEEYHSDPVLRLDNGEPLDFSLGGSAYYNPGLQGDNIQMSNLPGRH